MHRNLQKSLAGGCGVVPRYPGTRVPGYTGTWVGTFLEFVSKLINTRFLPPPRGDPGVIQDPVDVEEVF